MIVRENCINVQGIDNDIINNAIFFDLEHYVYKVPICIGVFGCGYYDKDLNQIIVTQYMIENKKDSEEILYLACDYFKDMYLNKNKNYIVTFSGNNDFSIINYLFKKNNINFNILEHFNSLDIQRLYEEKNKASIGLKALEKEFSIIRESDLISGSNLAKTFGKIVKDEDYINRMPKDKKYKILLYNEQDVVSLVSILANWNRVEDI